LELAATRSRNYQNASDGRRGREEKNSREMERKRSYCYISQAIVSATIW
jgi:hypothetical protein